MPGQRVSHHHVFDRPGDGGTGIDYRAEEERLQRSVALKFLGRRTWRPSTLPHLRPLRSGVPTTIAPPEQERHLPLPDGSE